VLWSPRAILPARRAHGSLNRPGSVEPPQNPGGFSHRRGEFFGPYLAQLPDLAALRPPGSGRPNRVFSHPGWSPGCVAAAAGRFLRPRRLHRRCPAPLPHAARPGSRTGPGLRFLAADPGFEPGKTVVGDFTDPPRKPPDLRRTPKPPPGGNALGTDRPLDSRERPTPQRARSWGRWQRPQPYPATGA
jgi:hypothetical protein